MLSCQDHFCFIYSDRDATMFTWKERSQGSCFKKAKRLSDTLPILPSGHLLFFDEIFISGPKSVFSIVHCYKTADRTYVTATKVINDFVIMSIFIHYHL